jgi:hypothetical protein
MTAGAPFVVCVVGDAAVGDALERSVKGRVLAGRSIGVSRAVPAGPQQSCQILYVSGVTASKAEQLIAGVRDVPILTISDIE